jgi:hypothetical protein
MRPRYPGVPPSAISHIINCDSGTLPPLAIHVQLQEVNLRSAVFPLQCLNALVVTSLAHHRLLSPSLTAAMDDEYWHNETQYESKPQIEDFGLALVSAPHRAIADLPTHVGIYITMRRLARTRRGW